MTSPTVSTGILDLLLHQEGGADAEIRALSLQTLNDSDLLSGAALFWTQIGWFWAMAITGWVWIFGFSLLDIVLFATRWRMRRGRGVLGSAMIVPSEALFTSVNLILMALVSIDVLILTQVPSDRASTLAIILAVGFSGYAAALFTAFPVLATFNIVMLYMALGTGLAFGASDHGRPFTVLAPFAAIAFWLLMQQTNLTLLSAIRSQRDNRLLSLQDPLTKLPNRSAMRDTLTRRIASIGMHGGFERVAVLCLDLDGFKAINDRHGHAAGDWVLVHVADILRRTADTRGTACRIGGDEYVVILPGADEAQVRAIAASIFDEVSEPFDIGRTIPARIGVSIGATVVTERGLSVDEILELADTALYNAKRAGRGRLVISSERHGETDGAP